MAGAVQSWQGAFLLGAAAKNVTLITSSSFPAVHTALAWMLGLFSLGMGLWRAGRGQQGMGREGTAGQELDRRGQHRDGTAGAAGWKSPQRHRVQPALPRPPLPLSPGATGLLKPSRDGDSACPGQEGPTRMESKPGSAQGCPKTSCLQVLHSSHAVRSCLTPGKRCQVTIISI